MLPVCGRFNSPLAGAGGSTSWLPGRIWAVRLDMQLQRTAGQTRFIIELIPLCRWKRFYVSFRFVSQRAKWLTTSGRATSGRAASEVAAAQTVNGRHRSSKWDGDGDGDGDGYCCWCCFASLRLRLRLRCHLRRRSCFWHGGKVQAALQFELNKLNLALMFCPDIRF